MKHFGTFDVIPSLLQVDHIYWREEDGPGNGSEGEAGASNYYRWRLKVPPQFIQTISGIEGCVVSFFFFF